MTMTLDGSGANTIGVPNAKTAQSATGTAVDFTGIPAGVKRITVMFNGISVSGTSTYLIQLGSGGIVSSGYSSNASRNTTTPAMTVSSSTAGFLVTQSITSTDAYSGIVIICNISGNTWVSSSQLNNLVSTQMSFGNGVVSLSGPVDRIRLATTNGTDTFDAGSINILYE